MKPASILITDDDSGIRQNMRTALEADGYGVREASSGNEALQMIEHEMPDLVVLDLNIPGVDGITVLQRLKSVATIHQPRVIVLIASGSIATAVRATRLGAVDFIEKPVGPAELRQSVRSLLTEPELDAPPAAAMNVEGRYDDVLSRIRKALRVTSYAGAEAILQKASERKDQHPAEFFNLLGVLYEAQHRWRLARKCYGQAIMADKRFEPAQANMRRLYELQTYGRSHEPVKLGDEE